MSVPNKKSPVSSLLDTGGENQSIRDKKLIEALRSRLNEKLKNPQVCKKAALILSTWIHQKAK
jgi:hypothetical protein